MTILDDVVALIKNDCPIFSDRVSKARNISNPDISTLPECWVGKWNSDVIDSSNTLTRHTVERQLIVQVACAPEFETGDDDQYEEARVELYQALANEQVGPDNTPLSIVSESLVAIHDDHAIWLITLSYVTYDRGAT